MKNHVASLIVFILIPGLMRSQSISDAYISIEHFSPEEHPFGRSVFELMQDKNGYIWLASQNGLFQYDGYGFEEMPLTGDVDHWSQLQVLRITEDDHGYIWGWGKGGLFQFDPISRRTYRPKYPRGSDVFRIFIDQKSRVWNEYYYGVFLLDSISDQIGDSLGFVGLELHYPMDLYDKIEKATKHSPASLTKVGPDTLIRKSLRIEETKQYAIVAFGEYDKNFSDHGWITDLSGRPVWQMSYEKSAVGSIANSCRVQIEPVWLDTGTYYLQYATDDNYHYGSWFSLPPDKSEYWGIQILDVEDWVIPIIDSINQEIRNRKREIPASDGIINKSFIQDKHGALWISAANGLFRIDSVSSALNQRYLTCKKIPRTLNGQEREGSILSMVQAKDGKIWIHGLSQTPDGASVDYLDLFDPELLRFENLYSGEILAANNFYDNYSYMVFDSASNTIWLSRNDKLFCWKEPYHSDPERVFLNLGAGNGTISDLELDYAGRLWCSTFRNGVYKIKPNYGEIQYYSLNDVLNDQTTNVSGQIASFAEDINGNVWIGTHKNRLFVFNISTNVFHEIRVPALYETGGPGMQVFTDRDGNIWTSCYGGVSRWDVEDFKPYNIMFPENTHYPIISGWGYRILHQTKEGHFWGIIRMTSDESTNSDFRQALLKFDYEKELFVMDEMLMDIGAESALTDDAGNIWYYNVNNGPDLSHRMCKGNVFSDPISEGYAVLDCAPRSMIMGGNGMVWIGYQVARIDWAGYLL